MDHKALIAGISPEERLRLTALSDRPGLLRLAGHWGLIAGLGLLIAARAPGWQALLPVQGVLIAFCFTLLHETLHRTPFATPWLNELVGRVCGVLVILPMEWFRWFHFAHHKHTNDPERDPELAGARPMTRARFWLIVSGGPIWLFQARVLLRNAAGRNADAFVPEGRRAAIRREARALLALYAGAAALIASGQHWLLWCWLAPVMLGQPVLRLYLMAEHGRCPAVANMLENSRTTFTNGLVRWLAWNMPYHAEHHAWPNVPFHRLPALHAVARPHLRSTSAGYAAFHRALAGDPIRARIK